LELSPIIDDTCMNKYYNIINSSNKKAINAMMHLKQSNLKYCSKTVHMVPFYY